MKRKSIFALLVVILLLIMSVPTTFAANIDEEKKVYFISECGESGTVTIPIELNTGEVATITVSCADSDSNLSVRASGDGDPATAGVHTVYFNSLATEISYKVAIDANGRITNAYGLDYYSIHNFTTKELSYTSTRAHLYLEWIWVNLIGSANGYLDLVIRDGCKYVETDL